MDIFVSLFPKIDDMRKILIVLFVALCGQSYGQTERQIREGFPGANFDYFKRWDLPMNESKKSILMVGLYGDSVFAYYITHRDIDVIELSFRYRYDSVAIADGGAFYEVSPSDVEWFRATKSTSVAYWYIGNIKDIELSIDKYKCEVLLTEHARRKDFILVDVLQY